MKKHWLIVAVVLIAAVLATTIPVAASTPSNVTIVAIMNLNEDPTGPMSGTFTAVGTDLLCPTGTVEDIANPAYAWKSDQVLVLDVHKHFTCDGGSGSFEMDMRVLVRANGTVARWVLRGGDGPYAKLFGTGGLTGTWLTDGTLEDTYSGQVHIE